MLCVILHGVMIYFRLFVICFYMLCIILCCAMIYFRLFVCCLFLYVVAVVLHVWNDTVISHHGMNKVFCVLHSVLSALVETVTLPASQSVSKCCGIWGVRGWAKGPSLFDGDRSQRCEMGNGREKGRAKRNTMKMQCSCLIIPVEPVIRSVRAVLCKQAQSNNERSAEWRKFTIW